MNQLLDVGDLLLVQREPEAVVLESTRGNTSTWNVLNSASSQNREWDALK